MNTPLTGLDRASFTTPTAATRRTVWLATSSPPTTSVTARVGTGANGVAMLPE